MESAESAPEDAMRDPLDNAALDVPKIGPPPSVFTKELSKLGNTVFSSATMGIMRALISPAPDAAAASTVVESKLPAWMNAGAATADVKSSIIKTHFRSIVKDTFAFTAAAYLMDGVEKGMIMLRGGKEDFGNKAMGGVAAGGLLAQIWYPGRPHSRVILTTTGALVGYFSYVADQASTKILLESQMKLEKELLHKRDDEVKKEVDKHYLRELIRIKQGQRAKDNQKSGAETLQQRDEHTTGSERHQQQQAAYPAAGMGASYNTTDAGAGASYSTTYPTSSQPPSLPPAPSPSALQSRSSPPGSPVRPVDSSTTGPDAGGDFKGINRFGAGGRGGGVRDDGFGAAGRGDGFRDVGFKDSGGFGAGGREGVREEDAWGGRDRATDEWRK